MKRPMLDFFTKVQIHSNRRIWYRYLLPRRLTISSNPPIYRWLWFVWGP
jgi:hypothetical protein